MADEVEPVVAESRHDRDDVVGEHVGAVVLDPLGPRARAVAALVGDDDPQALGGEPVGHGAPRAAVLRPAVQEHDRSAVLGADHIDVEGEARGLHGAHAAPVGSFGQQSGDRVASNPPAARLRASFWTIAVARKKRASE